MKITAIVGASILGLCLGTSAPAKAQHGHEGGKQAGPQRQEKNDHAKEHGRSVAQHSERHEASGPQQQHEQHGRELQAHHSQGRGPEHAREVHARQSEHAWQVHRAHYWKSEHHNWRERGGYHGERIPEYRFHEHFGRGHWFSIHSVPVVVVDNHPRFHYGGYWFTMVDPWPEYWAANWYQTDDVSIEYVNDGYYMYNRHHPGVGIAVSVSF
jgi:hypothetical protein